MNTNYPKSIKVLMVEYGGKGGLQAYTDALCTGLCENGADVTVLTSPKWPDLKVPYKVKRITQPLERNNKWSKPRWAINRLIITIKNTLKRNRFAIANNFDVVHIQTGAPLVDQFLLKSLANRTPVVLTIHDIEEHFYRFNTSRQFSKRYFSIPHRLIVHYGKGRQRLVENWNLSEKKIDVIPHGIMPIQDNIPDASCAHREIGLPEKDRLLLFFGNIRTNKGLDILLRALHIIGRKRNDVKLVIAGGLSRTMTYNKYSKLINELELKKNVLEYLHFIEDKKVDLFFAACDVVVLPYLSFEAQSGVLMRAYAHKKPVVVTDVGAIGESVLTDKVGLVVKPNDPEQLAESILDVLTYNTKYISNYTKQLFEKYSWKNLADLTLKTYKAAIEEKNKINKTLP
jgi:glycosyltransferase involved in cell wall biosynthesis